MEAFNPKSDKSWTREVMRVKPAITPICSWVIILAMKA
jgi:hypothetical protein